MNKNILEQYYKPSVKLIPINQQDKVFYIGKMTLADFENSYTESPAKYKQEIYKMFVTKDEEIKDMELYINDYLRREAEKEPLAKGFQRELDYSRLKEIKEYVMESEFGIIPNSIIVSLNALDIDTEDDFDSTIKDTTNNIPIIFNDTLYIPKNSKPFLIIDGQHRIKGCELLPDEIKKSLQLLFTFIINIDPSTQAQLFTTINYKVKPVSKSYLYHILGEFKIASSEYAFLHEIVKLLNELRADHPLFDRVKMLGKKITTKNTLSQAFLVEALFPLIGPRKTPVKYLHDAMEILKLPVFRFFYLKEEYKKFIPKFILIYLIVVKELLLEKQKLNWDDEKSHILLKTSGMGALISIIPNIYVALAGTKNLIDKQELITLEKDDLKNLIAPIFEVDFRNIIENEYSKGSGQGLIRKLSLEMWEHVSKLIPDFYNMHNKYVDWFNKNMLQS